MVTIWLEYLELGINTVINGDRVRTLRKSKGYSREKFAELIGIGTTQVYKYESGKSDATGEVIARMANLFNVTTDYLLGVSDISEKSEREFTESEKKVINEMLNDKLKEIAQAVLSTETESA